MINSEYGTLRVTMSNNVTNGKVRQAQMLASYIEYVDHLII